MSVVNNILDSHTDFVVRCCNALTEAHRDYDAIPRRQPDYARMHESALVLMNLIEICSRRFNTLEQYSKAHQPRTTKLARTQVRFEECHETRFNGNDKYAGYVKWLRELQSRYELMERERRYFNNDAYAEKGSNVDIGRYITVLPDMLNDLCDLVQTIDDNTNSKSFHEPTVFETEYERRGPRPFVQFSEPKPEFTVDTALLAPVPPRVLRRTGGRTNLRAAALAQ
ncbi:hypothetical protein Q8F55_004218 [Vanrija albida]|uniref:Uncharacterized protein n=1 Tax=Vanrija albida TaxID=181172 RepID=A0ABR3Q656_9TREE